MIYSIQINAIYFNETSCFTVFPVRIGTYYYYCCHVSGLGVSTVLGQCLVYPRLPGRQHRGAALHDQLRRTDFLPSV